MKIMGRALVALAAFSMSSLLLLLHLTFRTSYPSAYRDQLPSFHGNYYWSTQQVIERPTAGSLDIESEYLLGVGKADITGPIVEVNFMGYGDPKQTGTGLRQRLFSRAFIIGNAADASERIVYLVLDTQSGDTAIRYGILEGLKNLGSEYSMYGRHNVAVTGTHSHSGPAAWLNYLLPQITSKGFSKQSYEAIVSGAILSIKRAHEGIVSGRLEYATTEVEDANINRSLYAYLANPRTELQRYKDSVDKTMSILKFIRNTDNKHIGVLTWFPVHGTSMHGNNTLVTGDNKGVAAYLVEKELKENNSTEVADNFVAGFSQSNVGDTSPNILGAFCEDETGGECTFESSLCNGKNKACHGRGPFFGLNDAGTRSCFEIGSRQAKAVLSCYSTQSRGTSVMGPIRSYHTYKDLSNFAFVLPNGSSVSTCPAALGYSFAAGTSDGPGAFDFKQNNPGDPNANPVWALVRNLIHAPSVNQTKCHVPKPILLDVGETTFPYLWTPNIVDIQMLRVGQFYMIISPGEATTMAGRRWKEAISTSASTVATMGSSPSSMEPIVVLGGPSNTYTHYITTEEEYGIQRYEGASTLYGPHTLNAYINITTALMPYLARDKTRLPAPLDPGPEPPININNSYSFISPVLFDRAGFFKSFGDVISDVQPVSSHTYQAGETVTATFVGANPRNNLRLEDTYALLEKRKVESPIFERFRNDADWELVFRWRRVNELMGTSEVTIDWEIPNGTQPGIYRITYYGDSKAFGSGVISGFVGRSGWFAVG